MEENNTSASTRSSGSKKGLIIAAIAVVIILVVAGGGFAFMNMNKSTTQDSAVVESADSQTQDTSESMNDEQVVSSGTYNDGTYDAVGTYSYHSGTESIGVTVALVDGVIEEVTLEKMAKAPASVKMQDDFAANFESMVVGKNIDEVELGKVSGSSLTPIGFNAAIEDIKTQAQS